MRSQTNSSSLFDKGRARYSEQAQRPKRAQRSRRLSVTCVALGLALSAAWVSPSGYVQSTHAQKPSTSSNSTRRARSSANAQRAELRRQVVELRLKLERTPRDEQTLAALSKRLIKLGELQEALTHLRVAAQIAPNTANYPYLEAFALRRLKRYADAVRAYERFLKLARGAARNSGLYGLAKTYDLMGNPTKAVELYQEFLRVERRPARQSWIDEARRSVQRLQSDQVVLIEDDETSGETSDEARVDGRAASSASGQTAGQEVGEAANPDVKPESKTEPNTESNTEPNLNQTLSVALAEADRLFADRKYAEATKRYQALSQRQLPPVLRAQLSYFTAVSAYLSAQFKLAQRAAERGLLDQPESSKLRGLAVLAYLQHRERATSSRDAEARRADLAQIRLALREGRFKSCLALIAASDDDSGDPLILHAKGRALSGLKRYKEAYSALKRAAKGFAHPHLTLDLALTAQRMGDLARARAHYETLRKQTAPRRDRDPSLLHQLALDRLASGRLTETRGSGD